MVVCEKKVRFRFFRFVSLGVSVVGPVERVFDSDTDNRGNRAGRRRSFCCMCVLHARLQTRTRTRVFPDQKGGGVNWFFVFVFVLLWFGCPVQYALNPCVQVQVQAWACIFVPCRASRVCFLRAGPGPLELNVSFCRPTRLLCCCSVGTLHPRGAVAVLCYALRVHHNAVAIMLRIRARFDVGMNEYE